MTCVVTEARIKCKYTDCVTVFPVDCFVEGPNFLAIDPEACIDYMLCVMECPVEAICTEDEVPEDQFDFVRIKAEAAKVWPQITQGKPAPDDADERAKVKDKRALLEFA